MSISRCTPRWWSPDRPSDLSRSRGPRQERAQADQVVRRRREGHDPIDEFTAAMPKLAQPADGLQPTEDLLNQLPFLLADRVARMPSGPAIDSAALDLLRDVRRDVEIADALHEAGHVEALVPADRAAVGQRAKQQQRGF